MSNQTVVKLGKRPFYEAQGRILVIGDVHGETEKLLNLLEKMKKELQPQDHVVFVGDLVDIGLDTPGTLKAVQEFIHYHPNTFVILGNHEEMMLHAINKDPFWWFSNGGGVGNDFKKVGVKVAPDIQNWLLKEDIDFLDNLIPYYETELVLVTHAPIGEKITRAFEVEEGFLENIKERIRWSFVDHEKTKVEKIENKLFVCGHQNGFGRVKAPRFYPEHNRIFVDSGAGYYPDAPISCVVVYPFDQIKTILSDPIKKK